MVARRVGKGREQASDQEFLIACGHRGMIENGSGMIERFDERSDKPPQIASGGGAKIDASTETDVRVEVLARQGTMGSGNGIQIDPQ